MTTCGTCELPIRRTGYDRWVHEADGSDDFDPPHHARPPAEPAESSGAAPAAAGPHPHTPDRPGVLGRASYCWDHHTDQGLIVGSDIWARIDGGTREVLLVSPAAGRVLDAAQRWRDIPPVGDEELMAEREAVAADLIAAVDALDGDQSKHPTSGPDNRTYQDSGEISRSTAPEPEDSQLRALLADRDRLERDGPLWAREKIAHLEGRIADQRADLNAARAELATARATLARFAGGDDEVRAELAKAIEERELAIAHDRQPYPTADAYERVCAALERKRGELAEVTADRNRMERGWANELREVEQIRAELATARRDAAAHALDEASGLEVPGLDGVAGDRVSDWLDGLAAEIRSGTRPVPGSPQPAPASGQEPTVTGEVSTDA